MSMLLAQVRIDPSFWVWLGVIVVMVLIGGAVLMWIRRRMFSDEPNADFQAGGILEQMRTLRDEGKITKEEYDQSRSKLIAKISEPKPEPPAQAENE